MPPGTQTKNKRREAVDEDLRFVRELFPSARSGPTIVCASAAAWHAGIRPGMPLAEARSMAAPITVSRRNNTSASTVETIFEEWIPSDDRNELLAAAELTRQFAPIIGLDESPVPDCLLLDITGCGILFGGESSLAEQLVRRLQRYRFQVRAAVSDSVAAAWAFAHAEGHFLQAGRRQKTHRGNTPRTKTDADTPVLIIPPGQAATWLATYPISASRIPLADAEIFFQLGILTIGQSIGLPIEDLPSRLTDTAIKRIHQLRGTDDELITAIPETDPIQASWASEYPATNLAEIRILLENLVEQITEQLVRRTMGAVRLSCRLKQEDGTKIPLHADMVRPVQDSQELFEVLKLQIEKLSLPSTASQPGSVSLRSICEQPVISVFMRAAVAPLPVARQRDLFSTSAHVRPVEDLTTLINRLSNRLGKKAVLTIRTKNSPVPEDGIMLTPIPCENSSTADLRIEALVSPEKYLSSSMAIPNRPLRLLSQPEMVTTAGSDSLPNEFFHNGQRYAVRTIAGPERLQTQWWHENAVHRDYFRIVADTGSQLWIFRNLMTRQWMLHGFFD